MRGIIIKQPFAKQIIHRKKKTEYRKYDLPNDYQNEPIYLLSEGKVLGVIILSWKSTHKNDFRYKITVDTVFGPTMPYYHPKGAQLYVKNVKFK